MRMSPAVVLARLWSLLERTQGVNTNATYHHQCYTTVVTFTHVNKKAPILAIEGFWRLRVLIRATMNACTITNRKTRVLNPQ